jgi:hypothetical protein
MQGKSHLVVSSIKAILYHVLSHQIHVLSANSTNWEPGMRPEIIIKEALNKHRHSIYIEILLNAE